MPLPLQPIGPGIELAAGPHGVGTAGGKGTARWRVEQVRRGPQDGVQGPAVTGVLRRDGLEHAPGVGVAGAGKDVLRRAVLHDLPRVHDRNLVRDVGHHAQIVGNHDEGGAVCLLNVLDKVQDLGLNGHVQGRGGLVRNQQLRIHRHGQGDHGPLAHAAGKLVGVLPEAVLGAGDAGQSQRLQSGLFGLRLGLAAVFHNALHDLPAHSHGGVEAGHGVLEDHADILGPDLPHLLLRQGHQIPALKENLSPLVEAPGLLRVQPDNGLGGHGFPAPGLPHQPQAPALFQEKADAPDCLHLAGVGPEGEGQLPHVQQDAGVFCSFHLLFLLTVSFWGPARPAGRRP